MKGLQNGIIEEIVAEREAQDNEWGLPTIGDAGHHGLAVLMEEVGEVARAMLERDLPQGRKELVQVAAVALKMLEAISTYYDIDGKEIA